jgi:hypothetical protein
MMMAPPNVIWGWAPSQVRTCDKVDLNAEGCSVRTVTAPEISGLRGEVTIP